MRRRHAALGGGGAASAPPAASRRPSQRAAATAASAAAASALPPHAPHRGVAPGAARARASGARADHRPLHRAAHRPGPRLSGLLRRAAQRVDRDRAAPHRLVPVRTDDGKVGWVNRQQLETTLTAAGGTQDLPRRSSRRLPEPQACSSARPGATSSPSRCSSSGPATACRDTLSLEATIGQVQGVFSGTDFWHVNLLVEPWSDQRFSPFFGIGVGKFKNFPNLSLVGATTTDAKLADGERRRALLPHRALRAARRLLALHRLRHRPRRPPSTAPGRSALSFFF